MLPALLLAALAGPALAQAETITYPVEDFATFTPGVWCQQPLARGRIGPETRVVHSGRRAVAVAWDFTGAPPAGCFANVTFNRRLVGRVQELRVWVYATEHEIGAPLCLWINDAPGATYLSRARVARAGWQQVRFPLAGVGPAWGPADPARPQAPPLTLFGLAVELGGPLTGRLILADLDATTLATPREALSLMPSCGVPRNLFWEASPRLNLDLHNYSTTPVSGARCELQVTDLYREREVFRGTVTYPPAPAGGLAPAEQLLALPYGAYRVQWKLLDPQGPLLTGALDLARMMPPCGRDAPACVREYDRRWGLWGGVFGSIEPELARDTGAHWIRYENTSWADYEPKPGQFDLSSLPAGLRPYRDADIEPMILQTLYQRPAFRNPDQLDFAPAYGEAMRQTALAGRGLVSGFELGNEDNGPTKLLYTEVARHGAAGVRSAQPGALIANSGTAFVDLGFLQMQADRGLLDLLDVLCTHPYTVNDSPETWGIYERLGQVDEIIDRVGGMKVQWTTEFGWHHEFSQPRRAEWIPRHFLIGAAAGLERHGLYTWERDYGIYQGVALAPAVSVHALAKLTEGHRFVGLLHKGDDRWLCVWERAGAPLVIAWSPGGSGELEVPALATTRARDLFGNLLPVKPEAGKLHLHLDGGPIYVTDPEPSVLDAALAAQYAHERDRFLACLQAAKLLAASPWRDLAADPHAPAEKIARALRNWGAAWLHPISLPEEAVVAAALRMLECAPNMPPVRTITVLTEGQMCRRGMAEALAAAAANDTDIPSLRYLLRRMDCLADRARLASELGNERLFVRLLWLWENVYPRVCDRFIHNGQRVTFSLWPYLYAVPRGGGPAAATARLEETLRFVPGDATAVGVRVNSYSSRDRTVTVSLRLPPGWKCDPPEATVQVPRHAVASPPALATFRVTCPADAPPDKPVIPCLLCCAGLPDRVIPFDDTVVEPPLTLTLTPSPGLLPETPLRGALTTSGAKPLSGLLRLMRQGDSRALARARFSGLAAGQPVALDMSLRPLRALPFHDWPLTAQLILDDGRRLERPVAVDFACATRAQAPPVLDGDLADWQSATPLRLDREEYTKGSYAGKWTPEDCSAVTYLRWDETNLYFAARVSQPTFNQTLSGTSQWMQDSIQFSLARDEQSPRTEIGLAHTPGGDEVVSYTAPTPQVPGARLKVRLGHGFIIYEAAVPWAQIAGLEKPRAGQTLRYNILVNRGDPVNGRRFLERYGGIAYDKDISHMGYVTLLAQSGENVAPAAAGAVLQEDFEEYADGSPPDAWQAVSHLPPVPEDKVVAGAGRGGSRALRLTNSVGEKPYIYLNLVRPLPGVRPGEPYQLRFWLRGTAVAATGGVVGVCSDLWGNEGFTYADHGTVGPGWRQVVMPFSGPPGGRLNLIIRNSTKIGELFLDDIEVVAVK